jgi:hypothetical protein
LEEEFLTESLLSWLLALKVEVPPNDNPWPLGGELSLKGIDGFPDRYPELKRARVSESSFELAVAASSWSLPLLDIFFTPATPPACEVDGQVEIEFMFKLLFVIPGLVLFGLESCIPTPIEAPPFDVSVFFSSPIFVVPELCAANETKSVDSRGPRDTMFSPDWV